MAGKNFLHLLKYLFYMDKPNTQTSEKERDLISKYAKDKESVIEIGVYEGVNTVTIAKAIKNEGKLYGIDPFFKGKVGVSYSKLIAMVQLARKQVSEKVVLIEKLSFDAADNVPENVDFIFIDGDHSYEGIKKDWEIYSRKIVPGGYALLHDTLVPTWDQDRALLGSVKYYADVISKDERFELVESVDSTTALKKK